MKKLFAVLMIFCLSVGMLKAEKKRINPKTLPTPATELIERCWSSKILDKAFKDENGFEVLFTDRTVLNFDVSGNWTEMRRPRGLPACAIPSHINRIVDEQLNPLYITHIKKLQTGFEVKLDDGQVVEFDRFGEIIEKE